MVFFAFFLEEKSDFSQKNQRKRNFLREKSDSWTENRSFLEEKSDFRCLWYPYGTPKRPKRYHKLQKERFCSRKERLGIQKSLFFRTKSLFFKLMVPLWYQMGFRSASFGTISTFLYPYGTSHWGWIHGISVRKCLEKQQFSRKKHAKNNVFYDGLAFFLKIRKYLANAFFFRRWPGTIRYHKEGAPRKSLFFAKLLHKISLFRKIS